MDKLKRVGWSTAVAAALFLAGVLTLHAARLPQVDDPVVVETAIGGNSGELIVAVRPGFSEDALRSLAARSGASIEGWLPRLGLALVRFPADESTEIAAALAGDAAVTYAIPNRRVFEVADAPLDEYYPTQWGAARIQAPAAWDIALSDPSVAIAILDTGINYLHWDLRDRTWYNPGESAIDPGTGLRSCNTTLAYNGIDDDGNGYVDDCRGWDFVGMDNDPRDQHGHGTAVTGIAAATANNLMYGHYEGIAGIAPRASLMNVQVLDDDGEGYLYDIAAGLDYAAIMHASVVNLSFRFSVFSPPSQEERDVLKRATDAARAAGAVIVAASGNEAYSQVAYPAALDGVLAVGASTADDARWSYSNYGAALDVVAPGVGITSTLRDGTHSYGRFGGTGSGTSYATPHAAGVAALIRGLRPDLSESELRSIITSTADDLSAPGWDTYTGWGRLNAFGAVSAALQGLTLSLQADDPGVAAGGSATITLRVQAIDTGRPAGYGGRVALTSDAGALTPALVTLDAAGSGTTRYDAGSVGGRFAVSATLGWLSASLPISVTSGIPFTMALSADPEQIATGGDRATICAEVRDEGGSRVLTGVDVTFATTLGEIDPVHATTQHGVACTELVSGPVSGVAAVTAHAGALSATLEVRIVGSGTPLDIELSAVPASIAVGGESTTVSALVLDGLGDPVLDGTSVHFETDLGTLSSSDVSIVAGVASVSLLSGSASGTATIDASSGAASGEMQVIIAPGPAFTLTLAADPPVLKAGYNQLSLLTAAALDRFGNPVADGTLLEFAASLGQVTPVQAGTLDGSVEVHLVGETVAGTSHITVTAPSGAFGLTDVRIDPAEPAELTVVAAPEEIRIGGETATITITLADGFGNLVQDGTPITVTTSLGMLRAGGAEGRSLVTSTLDGSAVITLASGDDAGRAYVRAVAGPDVDTSISVRILPGPPNHMSLLLSGEEVHTRDRVRIDAFVADGHGNAVADGTMVVFAVSQGQLEQSQVPTDYGTATTWWIAGPPGPATLVVVSGSISRFVQVDVLPAQYYLPWVRVR